MSTYRRASRCGSLPSTPRTGGAAGAGGGSLVYTQNNSTPPTPQPHQTPAYRRIERYALQSAAREILPSERVSKCLRNPLGSFVSVKHNTRMDTYGYRNLETCSSVWNCPVCSSKISEKRRAELALALTGWKMQGGDALLLTLTVQHNRRDPYSKTLKGLLAAYGKLLNRKTGKQALRLMGCVGRIRGLEVTYTPENGWHPHLHVLLFINRPLDSIVMDNLQNALLDAWKSCCEASGLNTPNEHGCKLENGSYASQYVSKWGLESELTKGHSKKSRTGYSPFDLLRLIAGTYQGQAAPLQERQAKALFAEYSRHMKGKRQLHWSAGFRDLLGLGKEKTDEELVNEVEETEVLLLDIPLNIWKLILRKDSRGEFLEVCRQGAQAAETYLIELWERRHTTCLGDTQHANI